MIIVIPPPILVFARKRLHALFSLYVHHWCYIPTGMNESTAGADASVEALKLYHMKLTFLGLAYVLC